MDETILAPDWKILEPILNFGHELTEIPAPIVAAVIAGGVALWVSSRNLEKISANADKAIAAAAVNADKAIAAAAASTDKAIAAAAASTDKTITNAEERERLAWVREQTIERAAAVVEAADRLDAAVKLAAGDLLQCVWEGPGGHVDPRRALSATTEELLESFKSAQAEFARAADLFQFVGEEEPSYAVEMLRKDYQNMHVQVRLLYGFAVEAGGNEDPTQTCQKADSAFDAVRIFQGHARVRRELLLHKVRESLGLGPIQLDGFSVSIPATMSASSVRQ